MTTAPAVQWAYNYYGVDFSPVGDEPNYLVANGHPDASRVIAAFNRWARTELGLANLADDRRATADVVAKQLQRTWAVRDGGRIHWGRRPDEPGAFPITVLSWW